MSRSTRFVSAIAALVALLFAQLAVSAYACAGMSPSHEVAVAGMEGCPEASMPNLCDSHCDYGSASVGPSSLDALPAAAPALLRRPPSTDTVPDPLPRPHGAAPPGGHSPHPLILFGALRI